LNPDLKRITIRRGVAESLIWGKEMPCNCASFVDLELDRKQVSARIRASRALKKELTVLFGERGSEHSLYRCPECGQHWQGSRAWVSGNEFYLFKVPPIAVDEWREQAYVQPDALLDYAAAMHLFLSRAKFEQTSRPCSAEGCTRMAASGVGQCLQHHIESLREVHALPEFPTGRWFPPYAESNFRDAF
jgi:hypothetical protein